MCQMYILCIQSTLLCEKGTHLTILKLSHRINSALQPIINSSRKYNAELRAREREKAAFSSNLQSNSCLYPSFPPLHFCLSLPPLSANVTSYSSLKLFSLHWLQGHLVFMQRGGLPGSRPLATCTRIIDMTCSTFSTFNSL